MPSGLWAAGEYDKLPRFDAPDLLSGQPPSAFFCHQQNGRLCAGWVGCHNMNDSIGLRLAVSYDLLDAEDFKAALDYVSPVALFSSGAEAAAHGKRDIDSPSPKAHRALENLRHKRKKADMKTIRFSISRNYVGGVATSALIDEGETPTEAIVAEVQHTLATEIELTISDVTMFVAAWEDPEHWAEEWAAKLGVDYDAVPGAVAGLLSAAIES